MNDSMGEHKSSAFTSSSPVINQDKDKGQEQISEVTIEQPDNPSSSSIPCSSKTTTTTTTPTWLQRTRSSLLSLLSDHWFLLGMALTILLASQVQIPTRHQKTKSTIISYSMVSTIFLITGCTLDTTVLLRNYTRWKTHLWVQTHCFLLCSALMFALVSATATNRNFMDPGLLIGLIFLSCVPTTMASNVMMTRQAHGNVELTVVQTTIGNFIGVFLSPALVLLYTSTSDAWYIDVLPPTTTRAANFTPIYARVSQQLGLSIYLPLAIGQILRSFFRETCTSVFNKWYTKRISPLCMLVIIWSTYDQAFRSGAFDTLRASNLIFLVFVLLAMWIVYLGISFFDSRGWFAREDVVAITYCVTGKGPAVGVPLATAFFAGLTLELESKIQLPIVVYQGLQIAGGSVLVPVLRRWIDGQRGDRDDQA